MKNFWVSIVAVLFSCTNSEKQNEAVADVVKKDSLKSEIDTLYIGYKLFFIEQITKADFDKLPEPTMPDTSEKINLQKDSAFVSRLDTTLIFKTGKNKRAILKDMMHEGYDDNSKYTYLGRLPEINQYLVLGSFHESFSYMLIDFTTADTTLVCGVPIISPDKNYFICGNVDLIARFVVNGFDLYEIKDKKIKLIGRRELDSWGPEKIKWVDNSTLLVERIVSDTTNPNMVRTDYVKLLLK